MPRLPRWAVLAAMIPSLTSFAGRPLTVDDTEPTGCGHFKLELGVANLKDSNCHHFDVPVGLAYGVARDLEINLGAGGQVEERQEAFAGSTEHRRQCVLSFEDLTLGTKWKFADQENTWASFTLVATLKMPTADESEDLGSGGVDGDVTLIITKTFGPTSVDLNVGFTVTENVGGENPDIVHYGVAVRRDVTKVFRVVGEIFADTPTNHASDTLPQLSGGVQYDVIDQLTLDAAAGVGLRAGAPGVVAKTGLTWNY